MYDPSVARFTSEDSTGFGAGDPNLYRYVRNGPTNATDPSGMQADKDAKPALAGTYDFYFAPELVAGLHRLADTKRRLDQMWQAITPGKRQELNALINSPAVIPPESGYYEHFPGKDAKEKYAFLTRQENRDHLAGVQISTLMVEVARWEKQEQARKLAEYNALAKEVVDNLDWQLNWGFIGDSIRWFGDVSGGKELAMAFARSDLALLQWAGVDLGQFNPHDPLAREVVDDVRAAFLYAKNDLGLSDADARRYAAYLNLLPTRGHAKACEAWDGTSLRPGNDEFGRRLNWKERALKGLEALFDTAGYAAYQTTRVGGSKAASKELDDLAEAVGKNPSKLRDEIKELTRSRVAPESTGSRWVMKERIPGSGDWWVEDTLNPGTFYKVNGNGKFSEFEAKELVKGLNKPPAPALRTGQWGTTNPADSLQYHFERHGAEVGAADVDTYLRKAEEFSRNLKGATTSAVEGATPGVTRYKKAGKYIDLDKDGKIISFGNQ